MQVESKPWKFAEDVGCGTFIHRLANCKSADAVYERWYAPDAEGALYIRLEPTDMMEVAGRQRKFLLSFFAVAFINALATRDSKLINGGIQQLKKKDEGKRLEKKDPQRPYDDASDVLFLLTYKEDVWAPPPANNTASNGNVHIPLRDLDGNLVWTEFEPGYHARLRDKLKDKISKQRTVGDKPPRHSSVPNITLYICPVSEGIETELNTKLKRFDESFFDLLVGELTADYKKNKYSYKIQMDRVAYKILT